MNHLKNRLVDLLSVFKAREVVLLVSASSFNNSHESFPGQASWQYLSGSPSARFRRCSPRGTLREGRWSTVFSNTEDSLLLRNTLLWYCSVVWTRAEWTQDRRASAVPSKKWIPIIDQGRYPQLIPPWNSRDGWTWGVNIPGYTGPTKPIHSTIGTQESWAGI